MNDNTKPASKADFVEHSHPEFGSGYFCTSDVFERIEASRAPVAQAVPDVSSDTLRIDWCVRVLEAIKQGGREKLGDAYPEVLQVIGALKRVLEPNGDYQAQAVPVQAIPGWQWVPVEFLRGFSTLAHNYSMQAVPPFYYSGTEGDAFKNAHARCGNDLAELKAMLSAAPTPPSQTTESALPINVTPNMIEAAARAMERDVTSCYEWSDEQFEIWWNKDEYCKPEEKRTLAEIGLRAALAAQPSSHNQIAQPRLTDKQVRDMSDQHQREEYADWVAPVAQAEPVKLSSLRGLLSEINLIKSDTRDADSRDAELLDWLELRLVEVREPMVYGSKHLFFANPVENEGESDDSSDLRKKVRAAIQAKGGAA
ncbi:MAG: hypothetical protein V4772_08775 [Pseudomonadota bacterium]